MEVKQSFQFKVFPKRANTIVRHMPKNASCTDQKRILIKKGKTRPIEKSYGEPKLKITPRNTNG